MILDLVDIGGVVVVTEAFPDVFDKMNIDDRYKLKETILMIQNTGLRVIYTYIIISTMVVTF